MADILIAAGSGMQPAPAGQVTLFIDTDNNNILSYIDSAGVIKIYNSGNPSDLEECCSCEIAKMWTKAVTCALQSGMLAADEFGTIINQGMSVTSTETTDPDTGVKTCTVNVGPQNTVPVASVTITGESERAINVGETLQLVATVLPATAPQGVIWVSSNPTRAVVSQSGLVVGVSAGSVTIYAYSQADGTKFDLVTVTVS
jgi:uncharacterized protein YjdB